MLSHFTHPIPHRVLLTSSRHTKRRKQCWWTCLHLLFYSLLVLITGCNLGSQSQASYPDRQTKIIKEARLDLLSDETYYFPANLEAEDDTVYLPLQRWDIIFTGPLVPSAEEPWRSYSSAAIPGKFNHILIYLGKDNEGFAYVAEMQIESATLIDGEVIADGGLHLLSLGTDFGEIHHNSGGHVIDRNHYTLRWAKRFNQDTRNQILYKEADLLQTIKQHILSDFPYELEFKTSYYDLYFSREIQLVDDGHTNGAGCSDYWTSLLENYANICLAGIRMNAAEVTDYFLYDPEGQQAYLPAEFNPFGSTELSIKDDLLATWGFVIVDDTPHIFTCDGTQETGLVIPDRIFQNTTLIDIEPVAR